MSGDLTAKLTTSDVIILCVGTILALIAVVLVIQEAMKHMYIFGLRPSESVSTDIAGLITLSKGVSTKVQFQYESMTKEVRYNIFIRNKTVCVTAISQYAATDCSSSAFEPKFRGDSDIKNKTNFSLAIEKNYETILEWFK